MTEDEREFWLAQPGIYESHAAALLKLVPLVLVGCAMLLFLAIGLMSLLS